LGSAGPPGNLELIKTTHIMKLSSRMFLISADDTLHALANTAFMRMLRQEDVARIPDFAGQRVRQASAVVELVGGAPTRTVYRTFTILTIKPDGLLDVARLNAQQIARLDGRFRSPRAGGERNGPIVDAADRFVARGGTWDPDERLLRAIEAASLGRMRCPRVRVVP
jgi:hypothetical protein